MRQYSAILLQQWVDITLAARERHGETFFKKSAAAYFVDNAKHAAQNQRTPPDWWHDLVREERRAQAVRGRQERSGATDTNSNNPDDALVAAVTRQFLAAGQSPRVAAESARQFVACCREQGADVTPASLLKILA
jgi:hypothetical protein